jgi:hypothetical protein
MHIYARGCRLTRGRAPEPFTSLPVRTLDTCEHEHIHRRRTGREQNLRAGRRRSLSGEYIVYQENSSARCGIAIQRASRERAPHIAPPGHRIEAALARGRAGSLQEIETQAYVVLPAQRACQRPSAGATWVRSRCFSPIARLRETSL